MEQGHTMAQHERGLIGWIGRRSAVRGQGGFVIMAGMAGWMLVGGVVMTALLGMTLSVAQQAHLQSEAAENARSLDGALQVAVAQIQTDATGTVGVPNGKGDGVCVAGVGPKGGKLAVAGLDASASASVIVTASCSGPTEKGRVHQVVLTARTADGAATAWAALSVVAAIGGGNDVSVDEWIVNDAAAAPTIPTTTAPVPTTTVAPTTTAPTTTKPTTTVAPTTTIAPTTTKPTTSTTAAPTTTAPTTTAPTTTVAPGVTWTMKIQSDWGSGYCADVTVANPTAKPIDWKISLSIEGKPTSVWNANWSQSGSTLTASGVDWNRTVQPGGTQPWGFCAAR